MAEQATVAGNLPPTPIAPSTIEIHARVTLTVSLR
jgi:hypothetical protein